MKKLTALLLTVIFLFAACDGQSANDNEQLTVENGKLAVDENIQDEPLPEPAPQEISLPPGLDFAPLELIGYRIEEENPEWEGFVWLYPGGDYWEWVHSFEFEPEKFREYFFGTWIFEDTGYETIIDDTKQSILIYLSNIGNIGYVGENVIATVFISGGIGNTYWIDMNEPNVMYALGDGAFAGDLNQNLLYYSALIRADAPINEPEDNWLSVLRLREISRDYGIDWNLLTEINYEDEDTNEDGFRLLLNDLYFHGATYLISEEPDKLVLKSVLGGFSINIPEVGVIYTLERIGGEWERVVELDPEQLEAAKEAHRNDR
jgi:hypothetical protein